MKWVPSLLAFTTGAHRRLISNSASRAAAFTYTLGNHSATGTTTLYVPLTSHCNSLTLPLTRGPNFCLPSHVVAALCRVRDAELQAKQSSAKWKPWCMWLDQQDAPQKLPPPDPGAYKTFITGNNQEATEDLKSPTVEELMLEIQAHCSENRGSCCDTIVIAGEGEPTMRQNALLSLIEKLQNYNPIAHVRISTNGLVMADTREQLFNIANPKKVSWSVALASHDPDVYRELMQPCQETASDSHTSVLEFVRSAKHAGYTVEVTAVDRSNVNREATNELACELGVPIRWRSYFE